MKIWRVARVFGLVVALLVLPAADAMAAEGDFAYKVAARCGGEARFAIQECSCTVKNRLAQGWTQANVLTAFYADDVVPVPSEVVLAANTLAGALECDPRLYFMFAKSDTYYLGIENLEPILIVVGETGEVRFFERWYKKRGT